MPARLAVRVNLVNMVILLTVSFAILLSLAVLAANPFEVEADPFSTVPGVGPPWYLLAPFAELELAAGFVPRWLAGSLLFMIIMSVLTLPFWHRPGSRRRSRYVELALGSLFVLAWLLLSLYGARVS